VLIERKDRAYEVGANEPLDGRIAYVAGKIREAGQKFPAMDDNTARALAVGFPGFVREVEADAIRERIVDELSRRVGERGALSPRENPDYLIIEFIGSDDSQSGDYEMTVFSHAIDFDFGRPAWCEVRDAFSRAYTIEGREHSRPWPIIASP
jgi:hypothetical protein